MTQKANRGHVLQSGRLQVHNGPCELTRNRLFGHGSLLLVRGLLQRACFLFAMLALSSCQRQEASKENTSSGTPDVCICAFVKDRRRMRPVGGSVTQLKTQIKSCVQKTVSSSFKNTPSETHVSHVSKNRPSLRGLVSLWRR